MENMTIGEIAREANVKPSALRYYESIGLLLPTERINGQRRYDDQALKQLSIINIAKEAGFTLKEIETLVNGLSDDTPPSAHWKALAKYKIQEIDEIIARAEKMKRMLEIGSDCECLSLDECVIYLVGDSGEPIKS